MRLPRNHKIFRGQLDVAPFAGVFFLLVLFLVFHSGLVLTPGIPVKIPSATDLPGLTNQAVVVAVAANGTCYYENQLTTENELKTKLRSVTTGREPLTLVLEADGDVKYSRLVELSVLARDAGILNTFFATRPPTLPLPVASPTPPRP